MPFVPSHKRTRFKANKVFTDRDEPRTRFLRAFDPPPGAEQYRVLVFYGVGGEGKTALARHLLGMLEKEYAGRAGWAAVNFEDAAMRRPAEGLLSVRLQLRRTAGLAFPAFDTAFAHWFGKTYPGADIRQRHPELFRSTSEDAKDTLDLLPDLGALLTDALDEVPGLGFVYKNLHRLHNRYRKGMEEKGRRLLAGIEALQPDQLLDRLPSFLGADIADAIAAMPVRRPLAIVGDTMEAFHRAEGQKGGAFAFRNDRWLRDLAKEAPGVLFVLLGRDRLRWAEVEPEWAEVLDQRRLGALSAEDADRFLLDVPVEEPAIRARMVEGAKGLPFYLDLQVDLYESLKNQGQTPEPGQFGGSEPEILGRFLDHLGGEASRALTVLAHCRRFDEALWLHLGREFMGGLPLVAFGGLGGFSFVEELKDGWLSLHALMREALCQRTAEGEPVLHERVHRCLFGWWDERCRPANVRSVTPGHEVALEEATFHRATYEYDNFVAWAYDRWMPFYEAARYEAVQKLWETALIIEEAALSVNSPNYALINSILGIIFEIRGELEAAQAFLERALTINERTLGSGNLEVAITLGNLGNVHYLKGELDTALSLHKRALAIREHVLRPDHPEVAISASNIGNVLHLKGELDPALAYYKQSLAIVESELDPNDPNVARALGNLSNIYQDLGEPDAALAHIKRALAIFERAYGPDHPEVAETLTSLGDLLQEKGDLTGAQARQERALTILERAVGPDHPSTAVTLFNLSKVQEQLGAVTAARERRVRAVTIFQSRLGEQHPHTEEARQSLEAMDAADGKLSAQIHP